LHCLRNVSVSVFNIEIGFQDVSKRENQIPTADFDFEKTALHGLWPIEIATAPPALPKLSPVATAPAFPIGYQP
jgi:hypothetical protein